MTTNTHQALLELIASNTDLKAYWEAQRTNHENRINTQESRVDTFLTEANARIANTPIEIDLRGQNPDLYYPVYMPMSANDPLVVRIQRVYLGTRDSGVGLAGLFLHFIAIGGSWGGNPIKMHLIYNHQTYLRTAAVLGFGGYYHPMVFLRGGYLYQGTSSLANPDIQILTEKTQYYTHATTEIYNKNAGPITDATVATSAGELSTNSAFENLGHVEVSLFEA